MSRNDLPNEKAPNFNARLRETLMTYLGKSGDPLDRGITLRDLLDSGLASLNGVVRGGGSIPLLPGGALYGLGGTGTATEPDLTPPPTPTGFKADTGITTVIIEHDTPIYTQGHGHLRTHVYGAIRSSQNDPAPVFSDAAEITQFSGTVASYSTNPATTWHLWIKWESVDGVLSANPAGGTNGLEVTTGQDVALLLAALTGQLTEQQLYKDLGDRINLIDGPLTLAGSVAARIYTETQARLAADTSLGSSITSLQTSDTNQATAITTLQTRASTSESNIINLQNTTASQATTITSLTTRTGTAESNITNLQTTTSTQATTLTNLSSTVNGHTTSISTQATTINGLSAQYTVKIDNNGYVTGFGLASTLVNGTPYSTFGIRADSFYIASPSGPGIAPAMPFIVRTTATTINGVNVPAGVYMTDAFIQNGTITNAKIGNAAIDDAKISNLSAAKITAGYLDAARIQAGSLDAKIATLDAAVIGSGFINAARINSASIANANISTAQITSGTIGTALIGDGTITTAKIADAAITNAKIGSAAIGTANIIDASILNAKIGDAQVNTLKISGDSVSVVSSHNSGVLSGGTVTHTVNYNMAYAGSILVQLVATPLGTWYNGYLAGAILWWDDLSSNNSYNTTSYYYGGTPMPVMFQKDVPAGAGSFSMKIQQVGTYANAGCMFFCTLLRRYR